MNLKEYITDKYRHQFDDKIKAPLLRVIIRLAVHYPEPTEDNLESPNARMLLEIYRKFKKYHHNSARHTLLLSAFKILIGEYESEEYYAFLVDWLISELINSGWKPEYRGFPMYKYWNGPLIEADNPDWLQKQMQDKLGIIKISEE